MQPHSFAYIFLFLPCFFVLWRMVAALHREWLPFLLLSFSLIFSASFDIRSLILLLGMVSFSYLIGLALASPGDTGRGAQRKGLLTAGILVSFLPLIFFRFFGFMGGGFLPPAVAYGETFSLISAVVPGLVIVTLIQTGWLVDIYRRHIEPEGLLRHLLFVTSFHYVFAGPLVRYEQMGGQFNHLSMASPENTARGLSLLVIGLAKKILFADSLASPTSAIFAAAAIHAPLSCLEAWLGVFCFSFQVYFDFSGYTDMALGAGLMTGLRLPENFNSPYRSTGFIEFWRRWNITLSSWLKDYLFVPLRGTDGGGLRQTAVLFLVMIAAGLLYGPGITFLVWGLLHGFFLLINAIFRILLRGRWCEVFFSAFPMRWFFILLTFVTVSLTWVFLRSDSLGTAFSLFTTLFGFHPVFNAATGPLVSASGDFFVSWRSYVLPVSSALIIFFLPSSHEIFEGRRDGSRTWLSWSPTIPWLFFLALVLVACLLSMPWSRSLIF